MGRDQALRRVGPGDAGPDRAGTPGSALARLFAELFWGLDDAYGDGGEGGCIRAPVTPDLFEAHVLGGSPVGIYPLRRDGTCGWGCVDFDDEVRGAAHAWNLHRLLSRMEVEPFIERSRSKGFHVWVFTTPVAGEVMQGTLRACTDALGLGPVEVNPKQTELKAGQVGNYVRLPYPAIRSAGRQVVLQPETAEEVPLDEFCQRAHASRHGNQRSLLRAWPRLRSLAVRPEAAGACRPARVPDGLLLRLGRRSRRLLEQGPREGTDRSMALYSLGHSLWEDGLGGVELVAGVLGLADDAWGKFTGRADRDQRLVTIAQRTRPRGR